MCTAAIFSSKERRDGDRRTCSVRSLTDAHGQQLPAAGRQDDGREARVGQGALQDARQVFGVRYEVVGDEDASNRQQRHHYLQKSLVVLLLGVQKDEVERLWLTAKVFESIALHDRGHLLN